MNPDQSNASEAFWRSGSIHLRGFGPGSVGFLGFFPVLLDFCYAHPHFCYLDHLCVLISSQKSQKITMYSWCVFLLICDIVTFKIDENNMCWFLFWSVYFVCLLCEFTCLIFDPKFVMWCWCLALSFIMSLPLIFCNTFNCVSWFLFTIFAICSIVLVDFCLQF